jgi:glycosyltransferase involved in cell wall biosynthesis
MICTVAICTWNRASLLRQTLASMVPLSWAADGGSRLLVVDNGSTDDTRRVLDGFAEQLPLDWVSEPTPGHSAARNRALAEARSSHVLFTDDDVLVEPGWLAAFIRAACRFPDAAVFGGPVDPLFPHPPDADLLEAFPALRSGFCGVDHKGVDGPLEKGEVFGANMGFRLAALGDLRFDTQLGHKRGRIMGSEEVSLIGAVRGAGGKVVWVPDMRLQHYVEPSRMTLAHLTRHYHDRARAAVRTSGVPPGTTVAGVPRWLLRRLLQQRASYWLHSIRGQRVQALTSLREASYSLGLVKEAFALSREKME